MTITELFPKTGAPAFFAKAEMGSVRFQQRKICWRLLPSAARVRRFGRGAQLPFGTLHATSLRK